MLVCLSVWAGDTKEFLLSPTGLRLATALSMLAHTRLTLHVSPTHTDIKKAQTSVDYSLTEAFALPFGSNKQQEAYADMTAYQSWWYVPQRARYICIALIV